MLNIIWGFFLLGGILTGAFLGRMGGNVLGKPVASDGLDDAARMLTYIQPR